jgi:GcrA cell cycle regulator
MALVSQHAHCNATLNCPARERPLVGAGSALHILMRDIAMTLWTDEQVEEFEKLWAKGLSASAIGEIIGASRNAVLGKAFRMGLKRKEPGRGDGGAGRAPFAKERRPRPERNPAAGSRPAVGKPAASAAAADRPIDADDANAAVNETGNDPAVMRLGPDSCRFPIGDPQREGFRFCCKTAALNYPYCAEHAAIAYISEFHRRPSPAGAWKSRKVA